MNDPDSTTTFIRMPDSFGFTPIPNPTIYDNRLSFEALGLLSLLLAKSDHAANRGGQWQIRNAHLYRLCRERSGWGRDKVNRILSELTELGYLVSTRHRDGGRFAWRRVLYSCPLLNSEFMATSAGQAFRADVVGHYGAERVAAVEEIAAIYGKAAHGESATIYGSTVHGEAVHITNTVLNTDHTQAAPETTNPPARRLTEAEAYLVNALVNVTGIKARTAGGGFTRAFWGKHLPLAEELATSGVTAEEVVRWYGATDGYWYSADWRSRDATGRPQMPDHWQIEETFVRARAWETADVLEPVRSSGQTSDPAGMQFERVMTCVAKLGQGRAGDWREQLDERAWGVVRRLTPRAFAEAPPDPDTYGYRMLRKKFVELYGQQQLAQPSAV